jgi:hypothetical protein
LPVYLAVASIEPPKERKRLLGPGDNLPGAFHFAGKACEQTLRDHADGTSAAV